MEPLSKLLSALASLAWPIIFAIVVFKFSEPFKKLIESARGRKFTIKVAGNELTVEEASEQQRMIVSDLQSKLAELEKRLTTPPPATLLSEPISFREPISLSSPKRLLWVDDNPKNNSYIVAALEDRGVKVDLALSTDEGINKFKSQPYDMVISDMGRPEGAKAGIDLARKIRSFSKDIPLIIFCSKRSVQNYREEAIQTGVNEITYSGTTLLSHLPI